MKSKAIAWTIFGIAAACLVVLMGWFVPRAEERFVPWVVAQFKSATGMQHVPPKAKFNAELRRRLREEEERLAQSASAATHGPSGASSCLVLPVQAGIGDAAGRGLTEYLGTAPSQPASPLRECLDLIPGGAPANAVELNLNNATVMFVQTDLYLPGDPPIAFTRVIQRYVHWNSNYQIYLPDEYLTFPTGHRNPYTDMTFWLADKRGVLFNRISKGTGYADAVYEPGSTGSVFDNALVGWVGNEWDCDLADGRTLVFPDSYYSHRPQQGSMVGLIDPSGASLTFARDREGNLHEVRSSDGRWMKLRYQGPLLVSISDSAGERAAYSYDDRDRLSSSTNTAGQTLTYSYNPSGGLENVEDAKMHQRVLSVQYASRGFPRSIQVDGGPAFRVAPGLDFRDDRGHDWFAKCAKFTDSGCQYEVSTR
jgi:YD repeat-containing protein